ncbi:MAG: hypothetical protein JRN20_08420 [Nitrososphaerota archaeon]|jgi:hypothetical protein|nr:hypothetical protein [Nitrososphaerota archaeon]MDG6922000.1 hypothetical protein [Nitrososphaerota archaeon]
MSGLHYCPKGVPLEKRKTRVPEYRNSMTDLWITMKYIICKESIVSLGIIKENKWYPPREGRGRAMSLIELRYMSFIEVSLKTERKHLDNRRGGIAVLQR